MSLIKNRVSRACLLVCLSALAMILAVTSRPTAQTVFFYGAESGSNSSLYNINPATGAATAIGSIGLGVSAMAVDPNTGTLYGVSAPGGAGQRFLLRIDRNTGQGSVIGNVG